MGRNLVALLIAAMLVHASAASATESGTSEPSWPQDARLVDGLLVRVLAVERGLEARDALFAPREGTQYVAALVELAVPSSLAVDPRPWSYGSFKARDAWTLVEYPPAIAYADTSGLGAGADALPLQGIVEVGGEVQRGWVTFEIPEGAGPIDIAYATSDGFAPFSTTIGEADRDTPGVWLNVPSLRGATPAPSPSPTPTPAPTPWPIDEYTFSGESRFRSPPFILYDSRRYIVTVTATAALDVGCHFYPSMDDVTRDSFVNLVLDGWDLEPGEVKTISEPALLDSGTYQLNSYGLNDCPWEADIRPG